MKLQYWQDFFLNMPNCTYKFSMQHSNPYAHGCAYGFWNFSLSISSSYVETFLQPKVNYVAEVKFVLCIFAKSKRKSLWKTGQTCMSVHTEHCRWITWNMFNIMLMQLCTTPPLRPSWRAPTAVSRLQLYGAFDVKMSDQYSAPWNGSQLLMRNRGSACVSHLTFSTTSSYFC